MYTLVVWRGIGCCGIRFDEHMGVAAMQQNTLSAPVIRLAELVAALSLATDLGMGQPLEHALCSCVLAIRLGESLGLGEADLREVYYLALLHHIGCTADTYRMAALFGDELALRTEAAAVDSTQALQAISLLVRSIRRSQEGASPVQLARKLAQGMLTAASLMQEEYAGFCEVAERLAGRLGFGERMLQALRQPFERWDGKGAPGAYHHAGPGCDHASAPGRPRRSSSHSPAAHRRSL